MEYSFAKKYYNQTTCYILFFSWYEQGNFRVPAGSRSMKLASEGQAFGVWNSKENTFRFKVPSGTCKSDVTFTGTQGVHEFHFTSHNSEASFVPWAHYDYDHNNEAFLLDQAYAK